MPQIHNILGLDNLALTNKFGEAGHKSFRARQVLRWVHQRGQSDFSMMSDLAKDLRSELQSHYVVQTPPVLVAKKSSDGTRKWLFDIGNNNAIETVFIPEDDRGTLCISSQAGCTVACRFCSTGHQGFNRNLQTSEIIAQLWYARAQLAADGQSRLLNTYPNQTLALTSNEHTGQKQFVDVKLGAMQSIDRVISNVVMMGMGEPLLNYDQVLPALRLMLDDNGYGLSRRRVTVSTSGVVPMMDRLSQDCPVALAVSLHAPNDALRDQLVPLNKKYPLSELIDACNRYLEFAPRDFITFEYIMLDGVNDLDRHADELIQIARQVRCKLNLIPFNPFSESGLKRSSNYRIRLFADRLMNAGIITTVRKTRGEDIDAACGQLAGNVKDRTKISARMQHSKSIPIIEEKM